MCNNLKTFDKLVIDDYDKILLYINEKTKYLIQEI